MMKIEYTFLDRNGWSRGKWDDEPDKIQWQDEATGYPCLIKRNRMGALCGYVGVSEGHPYFQKHYDDVDVSAHGGLTYSDMCQEDPENHGICHLPEPGEPEHVWWLGFDCGHYDDFMPGYGSWSMRPIPEIMKRGTYRDVPFVQEECRQLAQQLKEQEARALAADRLDSSDDADSGGSTDKE